jgi:hypothetical protein
MLLQDRNLQHFDIFPFDSVRPVLHTFPFGDLVLSRRQLVSL